MHTNLERCSNRYAPDVGKLLEAASTFLTDEVPATRKLNQFDAYSVTGVIARSTFTCSLLVGASIPMKRRQFRGDPLVPPTCQVRFHPRPPHPRAHRRLPLQAQRQQISLHQEWGQRRISPRERHLLLARHA